MNPPGRFLQFSKSDYTNIVKNKMKHKHYKNKTADDEDDDRYFWYEIGDKKARTKIQNKLLRSKIQNKLIRICNEEIEKKQQQELNRKQQQTQIICHQDDGETEKKIPIRRTNSNDDNADDNPNRTMNSMDGKNNNPFCKILTREYGDVHLNRYHVKRGKQSPIKIQQAFIGRKNKVSLYTRDELMHKKRRLHHHHQHQQNDDRDDATDNGRKRSSSRLHPLPATYFPQSYQEHYHHHHHDPNYPHYPHHQRYMQMEQGAPTSVPSRRPSPTCQDGCSGNHKVRSNSSRINDANSSIPTQVVSSPLPSSTPPAVLNHPYLHPTHYHNLQQQHTLLRKEENDYPAMPLMNNMNGDHRNNYY